jgi:predicted AAA+ superfamily ATPase
MIDKTFKLTPQECLKILLGRFKEPPPRNIQLITGPRQVGKTDTLLKLSKRLGRKALYSAADSPESSLPGYWERLWQYVRNIESENGEAFLLIDEIQHLENWSVRLKGEWDKVLRNKENIHLIASGSSAFHLGKGSKESLFGRIEKLTISHWNAAALKKAFGLTKEDAVLQIVSTGAYPGAMRFINDKQRWAAYIQDAIIDPAISHDIFNLSDVRRPALLKQVFALAAASPSQIVSLNKLQGQLQDKGALDTLSQYLSLLEESFLIASLDKYAATPIKRRSSPPKLIPLSNALPAVMDPRGIPEQSKSPERFGFWVENAIIAHCYNAGQNTFYWREKGIEVDVVIEGSWGNWAIEVKSGSFVESDLVGLFEFTRRFSKFTPLIVCDKNDVSKAKRLNTHACSWSDFLFSGPPQ